MSLNAEQTNIVVDSLQSIAARLNDFHRAAIAALDASICGGSEEEVQRRVLEALKGEDDE